VLALNPCGSSCSVSRLAARKQILSPEYNLYSINRTQEAMRRLFRVKRDLTGNLPDLPAVFPDMMAPVVRTASDGERELSLMRWGLPATAEPRHGAGHERAQCEVALLARMAHSGMALPRSGDLIL
jgi:hypothetical protein